MQFSSISEMPCSFFLREIISSRVYWLKFMTAKLGCASRNSFSVFHTMLSLLKSLMKPFLLRLSSRHLDYIWSIKFLHFYFDCSCRLLWCKFQQISLPLDHLPSLVFNKDFVPNNIPVSFFSLTVSQFVLVILLLPNPTDTEDADFGLYFTLKIFDVLIYLRFLSSRLLSICSCSSTKPLYLGELSFTVTQIRCELRGCFFLWLTCVKQNSIYSSIGFVSSAGCYNFCFIFFNLYLSVAACSSYSSAFSFNLSSMSRVSEPIITGLQTGNCLFLASPGGLAGRWGKCGTLFSTGTGFFDTMVSITDLMRSLLAETAFLTFRGGQLLFLISSQFSGSQIVGMMMSL